MTHDNIKPFFGGANLGSLFFQAKNPLTVEILEVKKVMEFSENRVERFGETHVMNHYMYLFGLFYIFVTLCFFFRWKTPTIHRSNKKNP